MILGVAVLLAILVAWRMVVGVVKPVLPEYSLDAILYADPAAAPAESKTFPVPDAAALARARTALSNEPLNAEAYVVLALGADHAGRDTDAAELMRIAASLSPRELLAETWLMTRSLRRGESAAAVGYFDTIARVRPEMLDDFTGALSLALQDPSMAEALADRLAQSPPWRARFLPIAVRLWRDPDGVIGLADRLQTRPQGLDGPELRALLSKLWETGRYDQAYLFWLRSLPPERLTRISYLYNGDFQVPISDMPLDWETPPVEGTQVAIAAGSDSRVDSRAMTIGFLGDAVHAAPVVHDLLLAPGRYRFAGRVQTDRLETERGVRWTVSCAESPDQVLGTSDLFRQTVPLHDFVVEFVVPDTSCHAQVLRLGVDGRVDSEREARGTITFSKLAVQLY